MGIARSALQLQVSRLSQTTLALICSIIIARTLGPSGSGTYATLIGFAVLMQALTSFGFEDLTLARGPLFGGDSPRARGLYFTVVRLRILVVTALLVVATGELIGVLPDVLNGGRAALAWGIAYAAFNSIATLGAVVQASRVKAAKSALLDATWAVGVTVTYVVLLAVHRMSVSSALFVQAAWQGLVDVGYVLLLRGVFRDRDDTERPFRGTDTLLFWMNGMLSLAMGKTTDVLSMKLAGAGSVPIGEYNSAYNANQTASQVLLQGAGTMLYVNLGNTYRSGGADALRKAWTISTDFGILLSVPICVYCIVMPRTILSLLYGHAYVPGGTALVWLTGSSAAGRLLGGGTNQSLLFLAGRQNVVLWVRTLSVTLNITLDIVFYLLFGISGVAAASGGCGLLVIAIEYSLARRHVQMTIPWGSGLRSTLPFVVTALSAAALVGPNSHKSISLGVILVSFIFGIVFLLLSRPLTADMIPERGPLKVRQMLLLLARGSSASDTELRGVSPRDPQDRSDHHESSVDP